VNIMGVNLTDDLGLAAAAASGFLAVIEQVRSAIGLLILAVDELSRGNIASALELQARGFSQLTGSGFGERLEGQRASIRASGAARDAVRFAQSLVPNRAGRRPGGGGGNDEPEPTREGMDERIRTEMVLARAEEEAQRRVANAERLILIQESAADIAELQRDFREEISDIEFQAIQREERAREMAFRAERERQMQRLALVQQFGELSIGITSEALFIAEEGDRRATAEFLKRTAKENLFQGLEAAAMAPLLFFTASPAASAAALATAAQHFAVAALAGGAGAAVGRGLPPEEEEEESGGGATAEGVGGGSFASGGPQTSTIVVNINTPVDQARQGLVLRQAERAASRKFASFVN